MNLFATGVSGFIAPKNYDYIVKEKNSEVIAIDIVKKIQDR
jgi:hypothetical protein